MSDLLSSPIFKVLAGPKLKPFTAHAGILSKSDTLKALVEGPWKDSLHRQIKLEEWDEDTVGRCLEWLYSRDYAILVPGSKAAYLAPIMGSQTTGSWAPSPQQGETLAFSAKQTFTPLANQHFNGVNYGRQAFSFDFLDNWTEGSPTISAVDHKASLLTHAKLYCFASFLLLPDLQALAFQNLKIVLQSHAFSVGSQSVAYDIVDLITYVYSNTSRPEEGEEPLQRLLSTFIATNAAAFSDRGNEDISRLMRENGDIAADVWWKTSAHMKALTTDPNYLKQVKKKM